MSSDPSDGRPAHSPFILPEQSIPELTLSAVAVGVVLGIVFGASSLYLVLKAGMTVSASIPIAVLAITLFRWLSRAFGLRNATILENNIVQTTGSAGESIAFGVGVTMPALLILGFGIETSRVMLVACLGGLLGILMMIPLRKAFIVKQHGLLTYPEGTACAKVLIAGEEGGAGARNVFLGFFVAFFYQFLMQAMKLWKEAIAVPITKITGYNKAVVSCGTEPAFLGVGYVIGPKIASTVVAGGILASLVLVPLVAFFGDGNPGIVAPGDKPIAEMNEGEIIRSYVRYIGAGAVATGGFISLLKSLPLIAASFLSGVRDMRGRAGNGRLRTDRDLPMWLVGLGSVLLIGAIASSNLIPTDTTGRVVGGVLIVLLGFLFVTVSSRLTGEIGSSSNPISGMTIATLLATCGVFWALGWIGSDYRLAALCIAAVVCIASSNGGTTSQDLKTGFLVGATPWAQQVAILVGALTSAVVIGFTLLLLYQGATIYTAKPQYLPAPGVKAPIADLTQTETYEGTEYKVWVVNPVDAKADTPAGRYLVDAEGVPKYLQDSAFSDRITERDDGTKVTKLQNPPQASLFALIINGIMSNKLPWGLVIFGVFIAVAAQLAGVSPLAFAVGIYLPLATTFPIFLGGLTRAGVDRWRKTPPEESDTTPGIMLSSGYIAGGAIAGILLTLILNLETFSGLKSVLDLSSRLPAAWESSQVPTIVSFAGLIILLAIIGVSRTDEKPGAKPPAS
jgi:putative OPT family oligopeptide transporter